MVSPVMRQIHRRQEPPPGTMERRRRTPLGMTVVSPTSSTSDSPSTIGPITPSRKLLFERTHRSSSQYTTPRGDQSVESRQDSEIHELKLSNTRKEGQLRVLHERFHHIQQGLGSIDQERNTLVEKSKQLEKEKKHIQKQLELREREILALVKRCASQEEKMRESSRLRAQNRELVHALETVQSRMKDSAQDDNELQSLRKQLQGSELAREELQGRLRKVQREHDSIADTLQECLANVRQLTEEKQQIEDERRRERKRAEIEMEKQRLEHVQVANELKDVLETKQLKIDQMEKILQDNMYSKTSLRRERAMTNQDTEAVVAGYEKKISELEDQLDRSSNAKAEEDERTISHLRKKIQEKEEVMMGLEMEFSGQMGELMKKQGSLDEAEEEKKTLEIKIRQLESLECEHSALVEFVRILDSNLADLTSENAHLVLEKDTLEEESQDLQKKTKELEFRLSRIHESRRAREGDFHDLLAAEKDELREELETSLAGARQEAAALESELASHSRWIAKLEQELKEARRSMLRKEEEISRLQQEKEDMSNTLRFSLAEARKEVAQLEAELQFRDHQLRSITSTMETQKGAHKRDVNHVKEIERSLCDLPDIDSIPDEDRREPPPADEFATMQKDQERLRLEMQVNESNALVASLDEEILSLSKKCSTLELENESKYEAESKKRELEISLQKANIDLRSYEEKVKSLKQSNSSLVIEAEAGRISMNKMDAGSARVAKLISQKKQLDEELRRSRDQLEERENSLSKLLDDSEKYQKERKGTLQSLDIAHDRIEELQAELEERLNSTLEMRLEAAQSALSKQVTKTQSIEQEYSSAMKLQSEREVYNRQASSKIAVLDDQIVELKLREADLKAELEDSSKLAASKDRQIQLLELEKEEIEKRSVKVKGELDADHSKLESFGKDLAKKNDLNELLQMELQDTRKSLSECEERVKEVEGNLSENEEMRRGLESKHESSISLVQALEKDIDSLKEKSKSLNNQLQAALKNLSENESFVKEAELKVAEKSLEFTKLEKAHVVSEETRLAVEQKLADWEPEMALLKENDACHDEITSSLEETIEETHVKLTEVEGEKQGLQDRYDALEIKLHQTRKAADDRYQNLEDQHSKACQSLAKKQSQIESLEEGREDSEKQKDDFELQLSDTREEITLLEQEIRTRSQRIEGLEQEVKELSKNDIEIAFVESEEKRMLLQQQFQEAQAKIEGMGTNLEQRELRLIDLDSTLEELTKGKAEEYHRANDAVERCSELEDRIKNLDELIESREAQLLSAGNELNFAEITIKEKADESKNLKAVVGSMETTLNEFKKVSSARQEKMESQLAEERELYIETSGKLHNAETKTSEEAKKASSYQTMVQQQEDKITSLQNEVREKIKSMDDIHREKVDTLERDLTKRETEVALRDDEIRELRVIELPDKEEAITTLSVALQKLKEDLDHREIESIQTTNELKRENKVLKTRKEELELEMILSREQQVKQIDTTEKRIRSLETEKLHTDAQLAEQDSKLRERHKVITELTKREAHLEQQEQIMLSSCEQLVKSESGVKEELEKMKNALDISITRAKEDLDLQQQEMETSRRKEVAKISTKLHLIDEKLTESDTVLNERTSLLGDMVEHNKDLESKMDKLQAQIAALEDETSRGRKELSETQTELMRAREDLCKRENALTARLNEERSHRDTAERSLAKLKVQYKEAANAKKLMAEMEKDNATLKDKINRQEAYLQRKLQKDKVVRGRTTPVNGGARSTPIGKGAAANSSSSTVMQTPPRTARPSLHSTPHRRGGATTTASTMSTSSDKHSQRSTRSISSSVMTSHMSNTSASTDSRTMISTPTVSTSIPKAASYSTGSSTTKSSSRSSFAPIKDQFDLDVE